MMERLFSPWRSQYIDSFNQDKKEQGCIFCNQMDIDTRDSGNLLIYKGRLTFIILNLYPYNSGHLMVVPYRHTSDLQSLTDEENLEIMKNVQKSTKALSMIMRPNGFNIGANSGKAAGAGIDDHIHFHVVPRWNGDINFMTVLGDVKVISQDLLTTKQKLIDAFEKLENEPK